METSRELYQNVLDYDKSQLRNIQALLLKIQKQKQNSTKITDKAMIMLRIREQQLKILKHDLENEIKVLEGKKILKYYFRYSCYFNQHQELNDKFSCLWEKIP